MSADMQCGNRPELTMVEISNAGTCRILPQSFRLDKPRGNTPDIRSGRPSGWYTLSHFLMWIAASCRSSCIWLQRGVNGGVAADSSFVRVDS